MGGKFVKDLSQAKIKVRKLEADLRTTRKSAFSTSGNPFRFPADFPKCLAPLPAGRLKLSTFPPLLPPRGNLTADPPDTSRRAGTPQPIRRTPPAAREPRSRTAGHLPPRGNPAADPPHTSRRAGTSQPIRRTPPAAREPHSRTAGHLPPHGNPAAELPDTSRRPVLGRGAIFAGEAPACTHIDIWPSPRVIKSG